MIITIAIFFIAIVIAFGMLSFRAWQLRTGKVGLPSEDSQRVAGLSFRQTEKYMLYLTKRTIQWMLVGVAKYWFIFITKAKTWIADKWPKVYMIFRRVPKTKEKPPSYVRRAVVESKMKIKRVKEKVKREHAEKIAEKETAVEEENIVEAGIPESPANDVPEVEKIEG